MLKNIRPQSAKINPRIITATQQLHQISQENQDNSQFFEKNSEKPKFLQSNKKLKNLIKKSTGELTRMIPKYMPQQKERLYSQTINLKQNLHGIQDQNIKLKTKIATLEKQNEKLNNYILGQKCNTSSSQYYSTKSSMNEKQTSIIINLKRILKKNKQQITNLVNECEKMKRIVKYTQINQLQLEKKSLADQTTRLRTIIQELLIYQNNQNDNQKKISELQKQLKQKIKINQNLYNDNTKYEEGIRYLQEQFKQNLLENAEKQKKMLSDLTNARKRLSQFTKKHDFYVKQINYLKQKLKKQETKNNQISKTNNFKNLKKHIQSQPLQKQKTQTQLLKQQNQQLSLQLSKINKFNQSLLKECQKLKSQLNDIRNTYPTITNQNQSSQSCNTKVQNLNLIDRKTPSLVVIQKSDQQIKDYQQDKFQEDNHDQQQENQADDLEQYLYEKKNQDIQYYQQKFQDQSQKLLPKNEIKKKKKKKTPQLKDIGQLLMYRMKAQRYTLLQLKQDLLQAQCQYFSSNQLQQLFIKQPFYLSQNQSELVLQFIFDSNQFEKATKIKKQNLVKKIKKLIPEFTLLEEKVEQQMCVRIQQMLETYAQQLQNAFSKKLSGEGTICRQQLQKFFIELQLQKPYVDLIVAQLSLTSFDLNHLKYRSFFKRYYAQNTIKEEEKQDQTVKNYLSNGQSNYFDEGDQYNQYENEQNQLDQFNKSKQKNQSI